MQHLTNKLGLTTMLPAAMGMITSLLPAIDQAANLPTAVGKNQFNSG